MPPSHQETIERRRVLAAAIDSARSSAAPVAVPSSSGRRRFDAAVVDRLTASWLATNAEFDRDLRGDLERLRARSRDQRQNNEYAAKFARMVRNNVVGAQGFVLQCQAKDPSGSPDTAANDAVENAWYRQCRPGNFEVTGKLGGNDAFRLMLDALCIDGEILYRKVRGPGAGEYGFQIQLLDPARLDSSYNVEATATSNAIIMGVEVTKYRKPVAYHILTARDGLRRDRERVPASEIGHHFVPMAIEQTRGVPWMHASMRLLNDLKGYREAAVIAARIGACKMGIYTSKDGSAPPSDGEDGEGNFIRQAKPGEFEVAPEGYDLTTFDPAYPHDQFEAFCKGTLRGISSGIGVAYHALANDLEGVNFSSIRAGVLEEREEWMVIQDWVIGCVLVSLFEEWLQCALLKGLRMSNGSQLPASKFEKFSAHTWQGRRWAWVDPMKDIQASILAINNALASPQQIAAQTGRDVSDVIEDLKRFRELLKAAGIEPPAASPMVIGPDDQEAKGQG